MKCKRALIDAAAAGNGIGSNWWTQLWLGFEESLRQLRGESTLHMETVLVLFGNVVVNKWVNTVF